MNFGRLSPQRPIYYVLWYIAICIALLALWSLWSNIGYRPYLKESALTFVAHLLYIGSFAIGLGVGIYGGMRIYALTSRTWAGWIGGIVIALAIVTGARELAKGIPDIGWRIRAIEESEPLD